MSDSYFILPPELSPAPADRQVETPYGTVSLAGQVLLREEGVEARAVIYAAKSLGAKRILAGEVVQAVSPLLEEGDLVVPADVVDLTKLRPFTFFEEKGYGFIKLNPPFCPDLMGTLLSTARQQTARAFKGAIYLGMQGPRDATVAELRMYKQWGVDVVGSELLPEAYLARELELHYAPLVVVGKGDLYPLLAKAAQAQHGQVDCFCEQTMAFMKSQGVVGDDWRTWVSRR